MTDKAKQPRITLDLNVSAPIFDLIDIFDRRINLETYRGKRLFIGFFRHAGCPFCNLRIHFLTKEYPTLKQKNMEFIFFFESAKDTLLRSTFHKDVSPIPLIGDPEKIWYQTYGIETSALKSAKSHLTRFIQVAIQAKIKGLPIYAMPGKESINTMPAEFLVDENLIIRKIHYSNGLTDRISMEHIFAFAEKREIKA